MRGCDELIVTEVTQLLDLDDALELLRTEQFHLRRALAEPEVSFIVVPTEAETHPVRDVDGVIKDATAFACAKARLRRE